MENNQLPKKKLHSEDYFGEQRNFWWNSDFIDLMSERWQLSHVKYMLDIGCGIGHWGRLLAPHLSVDAKIIGIDQEQKWIEKSQNTKIARKAIYQVANAFELPFKNNTFDMVTCQTVLIHLKDPQKAIQELVRVLKPGGLLAVAEPNNSVQQLVRSNMDLNLSLEQRLSQIKFLMMCEQGKINLGEGDNSIGDLLPGYFSEINLQHIKVYNSDKAAALYPDYSLPEQKPLVDDFLSRVEEDFWWWDKADSQKYYIAGGGNETDFEKIWIESKKRSVEMAEAMKENRFHCGGGQIFYLVSGRKK